MQKVNDLELQLAKRLPAAQVMNSGAWLLFVPVTLLVLAFFPLVPPEDPLAGGGFTVRGVIEFGLILAGLFLMGMYAKTKEVTAMEIRNPPFVVVSLFVFWAVMSSLWSPAPLLTIAKAAELWTIIFAATLYVTLVWRTGDPGQAETILAVSLIAVLGILILANIFFWGSPLPNTGDEALPLHVLGEEAGQLIARPRLLLAYAHPLLTGDFLALTAICLFAARLNKILKFVGIPVLLGLLWMADARGPGIAVAAALLAMLVLMLKRNSVRAIVATLSISAGLAIAMLFQDYLLKPIGSFLTDDVYTLNSRTELWAKAFAYIAQQPVAGYGYYASRYLLLKDFVWAGHAHNSFIEVMLTTGLVGLVLLCVYLVFLSRTILSTRDCLLLGVFVYTLIQGMLNPLLFTPSLPMFVLTIAALNATFGRSNTPTGPDHWEAQG